MDREDKDHKTRTNDPANFMMSHKAKPGGIRHRISSLPGRTFLSGQLVVICRL